MRASLLAVIAIALIAGLGVVFAVKALGLLNQPPPPAPPPVVVAEVPPPKPPSILIIAPTRNIFAGDAITGENVGFRALLPEEKKDYEEHKEDYLPGQPAAAFFRIAARDLVGDRPLRKGDLLESKKPEPLHTRLFPGTRAVTVGITKDRSASGLIQVEDWVDVYLITEVSRTDNPNPVHFTGLLVPHARVVAKRDTLYPIYDPIRGDTVSYTLATNPYRAALLEHGRNVGILTLVPVSADEKKRLDGLRDEAIKNPASSVAVTFAPPGSPEYKEEQGRLDRYANGSLSIGSEDLVRILRLPEIVPAPPPPIPPKPVKPMLTPPPPPPITVELFTGVNRSGTATFPVPYTPPPPPETPEPPPPAYVPPPPAKYLFSNPANKPAETPKTANKPAK
ncbi:MAG TPA: Flp pilus assembly protein CpaB [Urbifossiella sp.]